MMFFRIVWSVDLIVTLVFMAFFFIGLGDGSVSLFNIVLRLAILGGMTAQVIGAKALALRGHAAFATVLAGVPALPAALYGLFLVLAITSGARWN